MANFEWTFPFLETAPSMGGKTDVVVTVHWQLTASNGAGAPTREVGAVTVDFDPKAEFTPFRNLTKDKVTAWVAARVDVEGLTERLGASLREKTPPLELAAKSPPWSP